MALKFAVDPVTPLHPDMDGLRAEAAAEQFRFVDKLLAEWRSGVNKFDQPGEVLLGAVQGARLLGVCGLNRDPYTEQPGVGRLRHLYVRQAARRQGVAAALVRAILVRAEGAFHSIRLRTATPESACFYATLGFVPAAAAAASHIKWLGSDQPG